MNCFSRGIVSSEENVKSKVNSMSNNEEPDNDRAYHVRRKPRKTKIWFEPPETFADERFEFRDRIASGGYAFVFKGYDRQRKQLVAIKVPNVERAKAIDALKKERRYLKCLHRGGARVPEVIWFGQCKDRPVLVMQLLGDCLGDVRKNCGRKFTLATILRLAVELIDICEKIHECGILHRDCKLKNYLLGANNESKVYIVDFGLSGKWRQNDKHINFTKNLPAYGTMRYAPVAVHLGHEQGRKDDLEAIGYLLIYLAQGKLPWQSLWHEDKKIIWRDVGRMKQEIELSDLCENLAPCFQQFMKKLRTLNFTDKPNYSDLRELFLYAMQKDKINPAEPYDWELLKEDSLEPNEKNIN